MLLCTHVRMHVSGIQGFIEGGMALGFSPPRKSGFEAGVCMFMCLCAHTYVCSYVCCRNDLMREVDDLLAKYRETEA